MSVVKKVLPMQKPAESPYPLHDLIRQRWSPVCFEPRSIPEETLLTLFEAARWAPSSYNEQPWSFVVATRDQPDEFAALLACLAEPNQVWAQNAGALLLSVAALNFQRNSRPNRHSFHDVGLATANLLLQAEALGLHGHPMAGFDVERSRTLFGIPAFHEPVAAIAIGFAAVDFENCAPDLKKRDSGARVRKPLNELVFTGRWGAVRSGR